MAADPRPWYVRIWWRNLGSRWIPVSAACSVLAGTALALPLLLGDDGWSQRVRAVAGSVVLVQGALLATGWWWHRRNWLPYQSP